METTQKDMTQVAFDLAIKAMRLAGDEAQKRVANHLRASTGGKYYLLANLHHAADITSDTKRAIYSEVFKACQGGNWALLKGHSGNGAKRVDPVDYAPAPVTPEPVPQPKPVEQEKPVAVEEEPVEAKPRATVAASEEKLLATLRELVGGRPAALDEGRVDDIASAVIDREFKAHLEHHIGNGSFPVNRVQDLIDKAMAGQVRHIVVHQPNGETREMPRQHYKFELLLKALSMRLNVAMVGPAGSGKTTAAESAGKALGLPFEAMSVGPMTSKADLLGFTDAHGKYHDTATVRMAVNGGVMLWDEFDAANASVATYGNMLLANDKFGTAEGMKGKHRDFCLVAGLNTYGMGANRVYVGRNQLDGATLDRFVVIDWDYDEGFEASMVGADGFRSPTLDVADGGTMDATEWMSYVVNIRRACEKLAIRHVISPRATIHGCKLFAAGVGLAHVETMVLWKGLDAATVAKVKGAL